MNRRFVVPLGMISTTLVFSAVLRCAQQPPAASGVQIRIVQGDGAINSIRLHRAHDPEVQVVDSDGHPVSGATVTFLLPALGAGGTFQDNGLSLTTQTDEHGMAAGRGLKPNRIAGPFHIRVTTSWRGQPANATLTETNAEPVAKSSSSKKIIIIAVIGGAAAAGAVVAAHGGGSPGTPAGSGGSTAGGSGGATITSGSPSFGPPH